MPKNKQRTENNAGGKGAQGDEEAHESIKCTVVGDGAVGKTSLLISYTRDAFPYDHVPTVFDTYTADVVVNGKVIEISLWDTAGQQELDTLRPMAYPGTDIFLVCCAVNNRESFDNVKHKWYEEVANEDSQVPIMVVGTKSDIRNEEAGSDEDFVSYNEASELAKNLGAVGYKECSALTQDGLKEVFDTAFTHVLDRRHTPAKKPKKKCAIL
eukprot:gb/GECG01013867.1/.p1 GENE.gb/GECG01013867.1/~~gb/GECG01013867.1/.p1  ORF type:complete len:212 (+),score=27.39 gb/GECG01013867.1/:1-636(+)